MDANKITDEPAMMVFDEPQRRSRSSSVSSMSSPSKGSPKSRRKSNSLPPETVDYLKAWMMSPEHIAHPYPTEQEKLQIMADTGIELKQLTNWFVNNRKRYWKPRVEARLHEAKKTDSPSSTSFSLGSVVATNTKAFFDAKSVPATISTSTSASSLPHLANSPPRAVSDHSYSSESESLGGDDDQYVLSTGQPTEEVASLLTQTEYVNVHIMRPSRGQVTLEDVSILHNVPMDRVLRTYEQCALTYTVPSDSVSNHSKIQDCRDAEILRLKKHYLEHYRSSKRARTEDEEVPMPRPKYRRVSMELWKEACMSAQNGYDSALPSLEEAATLFGFATS